METKFTPGPWRIVEEGKARSIISIRDQYRNWISECFYALVEDESQYVHPIITKAEAFKNAQLFRAAPELYEALRGAVQEACGTCAMLHVNPETYDFIEKGCPYTENNEKCDYRNCIKILRKARGEE